MIDPSNLWLTIHESIGHATELDRALGYEAAYAGHVVRDPRQARHAAVRLEGHEHHRRPDRRARPGHRSATTTRASRRSSWDIVRDGALRRLPAGPADRAPDRARRAPTAARSPTPPASMPIQRMANVSLQPRPDGPSTEELIAGVDRGIYIVGDKSWSIDMQRYNFQFTGQRFFRIENGRLAGQLRDVAYQATTTDFWNSMEAVGGPQTYVLGGAFNCGKGQPGQVAPVSHGCPSALFRGVNILNTVEGGRRVSHAAGDRRARAAAVAHRRLHRHRRGVQRREPALGRQHADHQRRHPVPAAHRRSPSSTRPRASPRAWSRGPASRADQLEDLVRAAEQAAERERARPRTPRRSSTRPSAGRRRTGTTRRPRRPIGVFEAFAPALGEAFEARRGRRAAAVRLRPARHELDVPGHARPGCGCGTTSPPARWR